MAVRPGWLMGLAVYAAVAACGPPQGQQCFTNDDCVAATCCHATQAVHRDNAPECHAVACTEEYQYCTTDDSAVYPYCDGRSCRMHQPPWCALVP